MTVPLRLHLAVVLAAVALVWSAGTASAQPAPGTALPDGCVTCHAGLPAQRTSTPATLFTGTDVHRASGFGCVNCHGGNSATNSADLAHDKARAFQGRPAGTAIVATCARCHSDAELMRRYSPSQRVDQATEYATSTHGQRLAAGDTKVATCVSCHGAHGIRAVRDANSPVYPSNVAATCGGCHADPSYMAGYTTADGSPMPTGQLSDFQKSVHHTALTKQGDLSAPTCNDCHGNHGAAPPGVGAVANVCGTCHAVFAQRFEKSVHRDIFDKGCVECHSNHAVLKPDDTMLGADAGGVCANCHSGSDDKGAQTATEIREGLDALKARLSQSAALVAHVRNSGMEVSEQELALAEAQTRLTLARTEMHTTDMGAVSPVLAEGLALADQVDAAGQRSMKELGFRRRGLGVSLIAILLVVIGLAFKVRQIDRRARP